MKLLVDIRKLSSRPSGIGIYTYNFINTLIEKGDIDITLITDVIESVESKILQDKGLEIISYNHKVDKNIDVFKYFHFIQKSILECKPDIFWEPNNIIPYKLSNPYGKIIVTIHDIFPITAPEYYSLPFRMYFNFCLKNTLSISDSLVYVSEFTKKEVEAYSKKAKQKDTCISYNIVDLSTTEENLKDKDYFLFIGNIEKRKGVDLLIKAYERYCAKGGDKKLFIAGGLRDKSIKQLIDCVNDKYGSIKYYGYIDNDEKDELLRNCSCFVFPSKFEGFGIPPLEALSYNKPCIVSNIEIFKEILKNSCTYFHLTDELDSSIINLAEKMDNYLEFEDGQKNILEMYSKEKLGEVFSSFLNQIKGD